MDEMVLKLARRNYLIAHKIEAGEAIRAPDPNLGKLTRPSSAARLVLRIS